MSFQNDKSCLECCFHYAQTYTTSLVGYVHCSLYIFEFPQNINNFRKLPYFESAVNQFRIRIQTSIKIQEIIARAPTATRQTGLLAIMRKTIDQVTMISRLIAATGKTTKVIIRITGRTLRIIVGTILRRVQTNKILLIIAQMATHQIRTTTVKLDQMVDPIRMIIINEP